jgi:hypothetical protein
MLPRDEANARNRLTKLAVRRWAAHARRGRLGLTSDTNSKRRERGNSTRPIRTASPTRIRSRSFSIVPMKVGNSSPEDPLEGRDEAGSWSRNGEARTRPDLAQRVNETVTDSKLGSAERRSESMIRRAGCLKTRTPGSEGGRTGNRSVYPIRV